MRTYGIIRTGGGQYDNLRKLFTEANLKSAVPISYTEETDPNPYVARNKILNRCESGTVFLIDDHVCPKTLDIFNDYEDIMNKFAQTVVFYGYGKETNRILGGKPVPGIIVKTSDKPVYITRTPCDYMIGIDRSLNKEVFNEEYKRVSIDEYLSRCAKKRLLPYNGFFIDIENSWNYFEESPIVFSSQQEFEQFKAEYKNERDKLTNTQSNVNTDNNVNMFIEFVKNKIIEWKG